MANELKKLIREAFNIAYNKHKENKINESIESLTSKMSSGDVYKVENIFRSIVENQNLAIKYAWTPQGSANGELNQKQFNLLVEMIYEKTDMSTKKNLMMSLYNQDNKALLNKAAKRIMSSLNVAINPQTLESAYMDGWAQMFLETQGKSGERKQNFEDIASEYSGKKFVDNKGKEKESNFGAYIATVLTSNMLNAYKDEMSREGSATSLDKPSSTTGKPADFGAEDDFGSDTQHTTMSTDDLAGLGAGLENPEVTDGPSDADSISDAETETDDYVSSAGDEVESDEENGGETVGGGIEDVDSSREDSEDNRKEAKRNIKALFTALFQAIKEYTDYHEPKPWQLEGFNVIRKLIKGITPSTKELALIGELKSDKEFSKIVNDYLIANGFLNSRGRMDTFENIKPKYIIAAANYYKTKDSSKIAKLDDRGDSTTISPEELEKRKEKFSQEFPTNQADKIKKTVILKSSLRNAIAQFRQNASVTPEQEQGLKALAMLLKYDTNTTEISAELGYDAHVAIDSLLNDENFVKTADDLIRSKSKGEIDSVANLDADNLSKAIVDLRTGGSSSLAEMSLNEFIEKNIDKLMERVYKRLAPKLNN